MSPNETWKRWVGSQSPAEFAALSVQHEGSVETGTRQYVREIVAGGAWEYDEDEDEDEDSVTADLLAHIEADAACSVASMAGVR